MVIGMTCRTITSVAEHRSLQKMEIIVAKSGKWVVSKLEMAHLGLVLMRVLRMIGEDRWGIVAITVGLEGTDRVLS